MMTRPLKLVYFNVLGRGELSRLILHYGNVPFEDIRLSKTKFQQNYQSKLAFAQLPVFELNQQFYSQSLALARYAAKMADLYPTDPLEALEADMCVDAISELSDPIIHILFRLKTAEEQSQHTNSLLQEKLPRIADGIEQRIKGQFLLGDQKVCYADVAIFDLMMQLQTYFPDFQMKQQPPRIQRIANAIHLNPGIAAYLKETKTINQ